MDPSHRELQESSVDSESSPTTNMFWVSPNHTIPGALFSVCGFWMLILSLIRARKLKPGQSFCELHVPEKNYQFLKRVSLLYLAISLFVLVRLPIYHCTISIDSGYLQCFFHNWEHVAMYSTNALVAVIALLECSGRFPVDSVRRALALCQFLNYIIVHDHAMMKPKQIDQDTHELWARLELFSAMVVSYSVYNTSDIFSYISIWALFVLKAMWIITTGIQMEMDVLEQMDVGAIPLFVSEVVFVASGVAIIAAFFGNVNYEYELSTRQQRLPSQANSSSNSNIRSSNKTADARDYECVNLTDDNENLLEENQ